jgi:hypothetical protein
MSKLNAEAIKNKILKYKLKYALLFNKHNNMLQYHNLSDYLKDRIILRKVENTSYPLPPRPDLFLSLIDLVRLADIDVNFKKPNINSETLTAFGFEQKEHVEQFSNLLNQNDISKAKYVNFNGKYYILLKQIEMLLLIKLLVNRPIKLSDISKTSPIVFSKNT